MPIQHSSGVTPQQVSPFAALLAAGQQGIDIGFRMAGQAQQRAHSEYYANLQLAAQDRKERAEAKFRERQAERGIFEADRAFGENQRQFGANMSLQQQKLAQTEKLYGVGHANRLDEIAARRDAEISILQERSRLTPKLPSFGEGAGVFGGSDGGNIFRQAANDLEFLESATTDPTDYAKNLRSYTTGLHEQLAKARAGEAATMAVGDKVGRGIFGYQVEQLQAAVDLAENRAKNHVDTLKLDAESRKEQRESQFELEKLEMDRRKLVRERDRLMERKTDPLATFTATEEARWDDLAADIEEVKKEIDFVKGKASSKALDPAPASVLPGKDEEPTDLFDDYFSGVTKSEFLK